MAMSREIFRNAKIVLWGYKKLGVICRCSSDWRSNPKQNDGISTEPT